MSFRKIRPSFGDSSASTSSQGQATPESSSTGSDPRRQRGEKEVPESSSSSKRRRVPESVTRNACLNCKKARAKCDGKKPCKRCATRQEAAECVYEIHIKHAKEELVKQIKELKTKDHLTEQILQALSTNEKVPEILERLKNGETYESIVEWLGRSSMADMETLSPRESQHSTFETSDHEMSGGPSRNKWTMVTNDTAVLDHLFQLYFAWIHPVHTLFDEGYFVKSYQRQQEDYCSSVLVNAICAMACHLHSATDGEDFDFEQLGSDFSEAAKMDIDPACTSITTAQSFAVMFLVDCARGNGLRAASYLRVATNRLRNVEQQETDGFIDVWKNTFRGIRDLNIEWSQITFQVPPTLSSTIHDSLDDLNPQLDDAQRWYYYRSMHDDCPSWPGFLATTNREKRKLTTIIHDVVSIMYAPGGNLITAHNVMHQYKRLLAWREELSDDIDTFGNEDGTAGHVLPHVLALMILYNNSMIQLLRPLLYLGLKGSPMVEETIWNHAQQGLLLLDAHNSRYSFRQQPVMQMFAVLHLTDTIARFFPGGIEGRSKDGPEAIQFGLEVLIQFSSGFPVAGPMQEMLRRAATECSIRLLNPQKPLHVYRIDDLIELLGRPSFVQPIDELVPRYAASFSSDWLRAEPSAFHEPITGVHPSPTGQRGAQSLMHIRNLLNTN